MSAEPLLRILDVHKTPPYRKVLLALSFSEQAYCGDLAEHSCSTHVLTPP